MHDVRGVLSSMADHGSGFDARCGGLGNWEGWAADQGYYGTITVPDVG